MKAESKAIAYWRPNQCKEAGNNKMRVVDHIIISEKKYNSFFETGLLHKLQQSKKYVPDFIIKEQIKQQVEKALLQGQLQGEERGVEKGIEKGKEEKARAMAKIMKQKGYSVKEIAELTGLSKEVLKAIKV